MKTATTITVEVIQLKEQIFGETLENFQVSSASKHQQQRQQQNQLVRKNRLLITQHNTGIVAVVTATEAQIRATD